MVFVFSVAINAQALASRPVEGRGVDLGAYGAGPARRGLPPRVIQAQRFLAQRGWTAGRAASARAGRLGYTAGAQAQPASTSTNTWQPLGPTAVLTPNYGLVTGRVSALALDSSDTTGNRLYVGTTGGGVWVAQNAGTSNIGSVVFTPLTDTLGALGEVTGASISIGALTVQAGGTGVILAGTGDPNDALDSYYGAGILRSTDGGNTWSLIQFSLDLNWSFFGEGFAGFAWSTVNPQLVVAAVSQAYEGTLVNADRPKLSYEGLYYSTDSGATWRLATITDGAGAIVQGPAGAVAKPDGNAATSVIWNPVRHVFVAAVRFHGYYQSTDGITWTRMAPQPGTGLGTKICPTNSGAIGSIACPIFRGTLAVNPQTGDTFAWTADIDNQDQGLWQDKCGLSGVACGNSTMTFAQQLKTTALETSTPEGAATIANGDYTLALAAVPTGLGGGQDTVLLAGDSDLWKCSLAMGCVWRNTTNSGTCMSAQVAPFQHALEWSMADPLEVFVGNDSGLWRSMDQVGETGQVCAATDANHFENLNGSLGSLAEVVSLAQVSSTPLAMMAGLGVNGTAGVKNGIGPTGEWPQILGGYGGPVAIDPANTDNWYVNAEEGISIYRCNQSSECTAAAFGTSPVVNDADVGGDGLTMTTAAPFLVDPQDASQLLIGTCRIWRGPANGIGWGGRNAISPILDSGATNSSCNGDALIRSISAMGLAGGSEVVYVGMYGSADGGTLLPGHVLSAVVNPTSGLAPVWRDLTLNSVTNDSEGLNAFGYDISSIFVDPHDALGKTVYVTVEGIPSSSEAVRALYGSTDGGAHWAALEANLPWAPASAVVVDPQNRNAIYLATDAGIYFTTNVASCTNTPSTCWSAFGTGLPEAPVVGLSAGSSQVLVAATYGRGVWETPLWTATTGWTSATVDPTSLNFASQTFGTASSAQALTVKNTGSLGMTTSTITMSGDFSETDNCQSVIVAVSGSCSIQVTFTPIATGSRTGRMTIDDNVYGGQLSVDLSGTGTPPLTVSLTPATVNFGQVALGTTSAPLQVEAGNSGSMVIPITGLTITSPFTISSDACGATWLAADADCQIMVEFTPTQKGAATGTLTMTDVGGTQTVALSGIGAAPPTDTLGGISFSFPGTAVGELSLAQTVSLTNEGDMPLTSIAVSVSGAFQTSSNCGTQLTGLANCAISVTFVPSQVGIQNGTLTISDLQRTQTVALTGIGVQPPAIGVSPARLSFAAQQVGESGAPSTLTVTNTGGSPMANVGLQMVGLGASSFGTGTTTCGATLTDGSNCTVQVIFTPASAGGSAASLVVSSSTRGVTAVSVPLNGTGTAATGLNVSPAQLAFSVVIPGQASAAQTVTVSNSGSFAASALTLSVSSQFSLTQNTCSSSLATGANCTVGVVFQPTGSGPVTGVLTVSSAAVANAATVVLSGIGGGLGAIQATPLVISFGAVGVGATSGPTTVTVTNPSTTVAFTGLALAVPAGFQLVGNQCAATLAAAASCSVGVVFAPIVAGAQTGSLNITSSTASASAAVSLTGMGFDFTVTGNGSTSKTVSSGQTASYTLVIVAQNGSQGTFTFQCGTLPTNALCLFNPASETLDPGVTGNVTVQISTGGSGAASRSTGPAGWQFATLAFAVVLLPFGWRRRKGALLWLALLAILAGCVTSCSSSGGGGGGSGGGGNAGATPPGTYSIPMTVTSTGVQHSLTITLTVD